MRGWLGGHYHSYILESIEGVSYLVAGGAGWKRMEPVKNHLFARVTVDGGGVSYEVKLLD
ncbi:hypothetical protein D3C83_217920 [compost metagenome]